MGESVAIGDFVVAPNSAERLLDELGTSLVQGRRAGTVVPDEVLSRLDRRLHRNKVTLSRGADDILAEAGAGGMFRVYKDGSATNFATKQGIRWASVDSIARMEKLDDPSQFEWVVRLEIERPSNVEGAIDLALVIVDETTKQPSIFETL